MKHIPRWKRPQSLVITPTPTLSRTTTTTTTTQFPQSQCRRYVSQGQGQRRRYASASPAASSQRRLNVPIDFATSPLLHQTSKTFGRTPGLPAGADLEATGGSQRLNLYQAVNAALRTALAESSKVLCFGEDVAFGGVFRCTMNLQDEFGPDRVFNTPITEQGIVGAAIGMAAEGARPVVEIQFADYVFPAFDQIVNEASKFRYREGATGANLAGMVIRMPCGGVGHGALYHTQSPESLFSHIPGFKVVMPRSPSQAKGLLLSAILQSPDPVIFMEPKILYRAAVEEVPNALYTLPIGQAEVLKPGADVTIISYGRPLYTCSAAIEAVEKERPDISVELIDLRTIYPWDRPTVVKSVAKTGRAIVVHESMLNYGVGAELAATIQDQAFLHLKAPVKRLGGWTTHTGLAWEKLIFPDVTRVYDAIHEVLDY
ncbi:2-oxoisovalerate dehydrogenase E1 component, beta subunit [Capronia epimyces CBS 606.96]|uniref:3-methyl-2-oxobutanoate dehydrogenase (2-methylpropanoyl-transferring) n=1 Tax=Capronia epimyces CBS 606.96 TaxID=1182542 RepID=W9XRH1_9EURO|nr:2-oxoisovalerate dehydrogenase E1 component, beta subunit [Capronia epimyces CBS 606.96]EXJ79920.1 2-oxoisovalerate dehydrogenase E1 component, beta subunit [Capronia epimyces CBS 606.96]